MTAARVLLILLLLPTLVAADPCVDHSRSLKLEAVRTTPGPAGDLDLVDGMLYVACDDYGLRIYDLAQPTVPWFEGALDLGAGEWDVAVGTSVAAMGRRDIPLLQVVDLTDTTAPRTAGSVPLPGRVIDADAQGAYAWLICDPEVAEESTVLVTVDLSDPDLPVITDTDDIPDQSASVVAGDMRVCVAGPLMPNLTVFDAFDAAAPTPLGTWHGGGLVRDVALEAGQAVLTGLDMLAGLDVSGAGDPAHVWSWDPDGLSLDGVALFGGRFVLTGDGVDDGIGLRVLDLLSPVDEPVRASSAMTARDVATLGSTIYLARGDDGVAVVSADDLRPARPAHVHGPESAWDVVIDAAASGQRAVALVETRNAQGSDVGRLWTFDAADPDAPARCGFVDVPTEPRVVALADNIAAVANYRPTLGYGELQLVRVADPCNPTFAGQIFLDGDPSAILMRGRTVDVFVRSTDVGTSSQWVTIDVSNPDLPVITRLWPLIAEPVAAAATDGLMVVSYVEALDVYDISGADPVLVGDWFTSFTYTAVAISGTDLLLGAHGFLIGADVDQPGVLDLHGSMWLPGVCGDIVLDGATAYVASTDLLVVDVGAFEAPSLIGTAGPGAGRGAAMGNGVLYAASGPAGLHTLRPHCFDGVPLEVSGLAGYAEPHLAVLEWTVHGDLEPERMRLMAGRAPRIRDVPIEADGMAYTARDWRARGTVTYALQIRDARGEWITLDEMRLRIPDADVPSASALGDPFPNPFNPSVTVPFALARTGPVTVSVHDAAGRRLTTLADGSWPYGRHELVWDGRDDAGRAMPAGVYMVHLRSEAGEDSSKVMLVR